MQGGINQIVKSIKILNMTAKDQIKIINAGFTIIRREGAESFSNKKIKYKSKDQREWATLEDGFTSNYKMDNRVKELLKISTIVED